MAKKPTPPPPIKPDFSDAAKKSAGIDLHGFKKELALIKSKHLAELSTLKTTLEGVQAALRNALAALDEGRRGDAAKILRAAVPRPPAGPGTGGDGAA